MKAGSLNWNEATSEGTATLSAEFETADEITQLDALRDWLYDLTEKYNGLIQSRADAEKVKIP